MNYGKGRENQSNESVEETSSWLGYRSDLNLFHSLKIVSKC